MSVELRRAEEGGMISSYLTGWVCSVRVSRWILDTYDLSAVFCFFHVLTRYLRGFISIRNQCKATYITSWTSQFHQRFNNIRTAVACTDKVRRKLHNHPPWRLREIPRLTCQRSPTLHFGLDSHVCTPLTHALPHAPIKHARKRVCHTIFHRRLTYPAENRIPLPLPLHCLPCRSHNYRGKKQVRENDRGKTFSLELEDGPVVIAPRKATRWMFVKPLCFSYFFLSQRLVYLLNHCSYSIFRGAAVGFTASLLLNNINLLINIWNIFDGFQWCAKFPIRVN